MVEGESEALALPSYGPVKHATQGWAIHDDGLHRKADEPAAELVPHD